MTDFDLNHVINWVPPIARRRVIGRNETLPSSPPPRDPTVRRVRLATSLAGILQCRHTSL